MEKEKQIATPLLDFGDSIKSATTEKDIATETYDTWKSSYRGIPLATHFYFLNNNIIDETKGKALKPITQSGMVMSMVYAPFLPMSKLNLKKIKYDEQYYGTVKENASSPQDYDNDTFVYKIDGYSTPQQIAFENEIVPNNTPIVKYDKGLIDDLRQKGRKHWSNESKLYQAPYFYQTINDGISTPLRVESHLVINSSDSDNEVHLYSKQGVSINGGYLLYVKGYKGNKYGRTEGIVSTGGLDLPTSSSQYAQFMATSKSSFITANEVASRNETMNASKSVASSIGKIATGVGALAVGTALAPVTGGTSLIGATALTGAMALGSQTTGISNIGGGVAGGVGAGINLAHERRNRIETNQAKINDLMNAPRNVSLGSGDILQTIDNSNKQLKLYRYWITDYYKEKLCDYWTLYGYSQNKMMDVNYKSRKYFNYIKTMDANIVPKDNALIDKEEIEEIKEIFNNGVTWWHEFDCNQDSVKMYDYNSKDNFEVKR